MKTTEKRKRNLIEKLEARQLMSYTGTWASTSAPSTSRTIYVSSSGPIKTLAQAVNASTNGTKILFQRGQTFYGSGATESSSNIYIGAYGSGADPILVGANSSASTSSILSLKGSGIRIEGLQFSDRDTSTKFTAISTSTSKNVFINKCGGDTNLENFVYIGQYSSGTTVSHSYTLQGQNAYFVYSALGSKYVNLEFNYSNHSRTEHGIRLHSTNFKVYANYIIQRVNSRYSYKSALCVREGSNGYIGSNRFSGAQVTILGPLASRKTATLTNVMYENNLAENASQFQLFEGLTGLTMRNNTIKKLYGGTVMFIENSDANRSSVQGSITGNKYVGNNFVGGDTSKLSISGNTRISY